MWQPAILLLGLVQCTAYVSAQKTDYDPLLYVDQLIGTAGDGKWLSSLIQFWSR